MEYMPGDSILIKNIVTQLKSQGIFDQFRKECIADVDTKPAYQNLCHLADTQVSKFLSKVKWGPDLHKNQIRENIRKHVNECNFVEPGIAIIVDQLVNPRINTVLVPKVEDMLYKYLGIPREPESVASRKEFKAFNDRSTGKDAFDSGFESNSARENFNRRKDMEKSHTTDSARSQENNKFDGHRSENKSASFKSDATNKVQFNDKSWRDLKPPGIKSEPADTDISKGKPSKQTDSEKSEPKIEIKEELITSVAMDTESSDDEMSPPYELHEKSDADMSLDSGDSNYSEIIDVKTTEPDIPGFEPQIERIGEIEDSKIITEHEDSMDSVHTACSTHSAPEKITISPLEIPKTPTINYETSEDSDDAVKNKNTLNTGTSIDVSAVQLDEVPDVNFDKIVEKVIEDNTDHVSKQLDKSSSAVVEPKPQKDEEISSKPKDKSTSDDAIKKPKPKDEKPKSTDNKEKHTGEKKHDHKSDKDKSKHDKYKSDHKSKDKEKEKSKHDSKSHKKDEKSHHSKDRDRSRSDHDRKSKSEYKKDDKNDPKKDHKSTHKKDDKSDRKKDDKTGDHRKDDDKKQSRDDKDKKKDSSKSSSDDKRSKSKSDDSKHKHDDRKSKDGEHSSQKSKKKEDDKKSRSHCNAEERKKTDRRSSDRDSSGPSASNSSLHTSHSHSSKSEKDKGSSKYKHSSSSHKSKKNDGSTSKPADKTAASSEDNKINEDDLEMILESSPEKAYQRPVAHSDTHFDDNIFSSIRTNANEKNDDNIEDMMNEMFKPTKTTVPSEIKNSPTPDGATTLPANGTDLGLLKKPKIAKNFADIRRIMKLRKLYKDSFKLKEEQGKENANIKSAVQPLDGEKKTPSEIRLKKTVEYFVTRRFGKNGSNANKCRELTTAIIETLTDVKLNITRVDRRYSIVDGSCSLSNEKKINENGLLLDNNNEDGKSNLMTDQEVQNIPDIMNDETANLVLDDLAKSYVDHEFNVEKISVSSEDEKLTKSRTSETKANGAKKKLSNKFKKQLLDADNTATPEVQPNLEDIIGCGRTSQITYKQNDTVDDTSPSLKLKFKSTFDGKNKTWHAFEQAEDIEDPVFYLPPPSPKEEFRKCAAKLIENELNIDVDELVVEMDYPECYDCVFTSQLGAKITRKRVAKDSTKYNFEIITKNTDDKTITLRIKKSSESNEPESKKIKINKVEDIVSDLDTTVDDCQQTSIKIENKKAPVKRKNENMKRKTLGIKRSLLSASANSPNALKLSAAEQTDDSDFSLRKTLKGAKNKNSKEILNTNHKRSESESSDGRRSSVSSTGNNTHVKGINDIGTTPTATKTKTKNSLANDSKTESPSELDITNVATTTKATDQPKKVVDAKTLEEKRKQTIMNCYYDESDLYKPRPSFRLTSRRYRLGNTENT